MTEKGDAAAAIDERWLVPLGFVTTSGPVKSIHCSAEELEVKGKKKRKEWKQTGTWKPGESTRQKCITRESAESKFLSLSKVLQLRWEPQKPPCAGSEPRGTDLTAVFDFTVGKQERPLLWALPCVHTLRLLLYLSRTMLWRRNFYPTNLVRRLEMSKILHKADFEVSGSWNAAEVTPFSFFFPPAIVVSTNVVMWCEPGTHPLLHDSLLVGSDSRRQIWEPNVTPHTTL